jgi:hypothetical protein
MEFTGTYPFREVLKLLGPASTGTYRGLFLFNDKNLLTK